MEAFHINLFTRFINLGKWHRKKHRPLTLMVRFSAFQWNGMSERKHVGPQLNSLDRKTIKLLRVFLFFWWNVRKMVVWLRSNYLLINRLDWLWHCVVQTNKKQNGNDAWESLIESIARIQSNWIISFSNWISTDWFWVRSVTRKTQKINKMFNTFSISFTYIRVFGGFMCIYNNST